MRVDQPSLRLTDVQEAEVGRVARHTEDSEQQRPGQTGRERKGWGDLGQGGGSSPVVVVVSLRVSHRDLSPAPVVEDVATHRILGVPGQRGPLSLL